MDGIVTVERFTNVVHVYMPTHSGPIVTVSLYGFAIGSKPDIELIALARAELQRKLESEIFALVSVTPKGQRLLCENCALVQPSIQPTH